MIPARVRAPFDDRPLAREGVVAAALFGAFVLWTQVLLEIGVRFGHAFDGYLDLGSGVGALADNALLADVVVIAGMVAFAAVYARVRGMSLPLAVPDRSGLHLVVAAVAVPIASVAAVHGLADLTGTSLAALEGRYVAEDVSLFVSGVVTSLELLLGLPAYVLLAHVLVQRTLGTATRAPVAIGLTTLVVGLVGPTELVGVGAPLRTVAVTVLLPTSIALPIYAAHSFDADWLPWVCAVPLALFGVGLLTSWLADVDGLAGAAFALAQVGVVGLAAYAYEETGSLLPPALAYASLVVATEATIVLFEAGVRP
jgi:hypothetical protein